MGSRTPPCSISCKVPLDIATIEAVVGIKEIEDVKAVVDVLLGAAYSVFTILVM